MGGHNAPMPILWGLALFAAASPAEHLQDTARIRALLTIEDARPRARSGLAPLLDAAASPDTFVAAWAVRGLGRQQRADLIPTLQVALTSGTPAIRAEAVNAIGQSALREGTADARRILEDRVALEPDPQVLGTILRTLGRLPTATAEERDRTETLLVRASTGASGDAAAAVLEGTAHGLGSLFRRTAQRQPPSVDAIERLAALIAIRYPPMVRRLAMAALVSSGRADSGILLEALHDSEREVRRLAVLTTFAAPQLAGRERVVRRAWNDPDPGVRFEALRAFGRYMSAREGCAPIVAALDDPDPQVALLAVDLLGGCGAVAASKLASLARELTTPEAWHRPAHALVALARIDSAAATALLPGFAASPVPWSRMYAARAAETVGATPVLARLARDPNGNTREAALGGLQRTVGHAADSLYLAALDAREYQVLLTAAQALDSSPHPRAVPALLASLARVTAERKETSRDPREAMLTSIGHLGGVTNAAALRPYIADFDTTVAASAAAILSRWTGSAVEPAAKPLPLAAVPSATELARFARLTAVFHLQGGGIVKVRLRPFDAPTNVARFVRMARSGWFNGLTFHRVVPNFVIQGGSPAANEYVGDGPFTRDELGLPSHTRGTMGISTRGRDTGDGQLFVNLVDNSRLDHDYTIIGEVIEGMNVVDRMLEGVVILRVDLLEDSR